MQRNRKMNKVNENIKLVPELRFTEFETDGEWRLEAIDNLSETVTAGGTPSTKKEDYWGGNIRWMNSGELNLKIVREVEGRITDKGLKNSSTKIIPENCVLIGLAGQGKTRGTVAINKVELCTNQSIASIFPNDKVFDSSYLYHNLDNRYNELRELSAGGQGRGGLNLKIIKEIKIPIPPEKTEQQKIAATLTSLDHLIAAENEKLEALQAHKKGLLQQLFPAKGEKVPKLRFGEFSGEWEEKALGSIAENLSNKRIPITSAKREKGNIPYYGATGIIDYVKDFIFEEDLLLISEDGANLMDRNYPIAFAISGKTWVNNHAHVLKFKNKSTEALVQRFINSRSIEDYLTGQAQPKLNRKNLDRIPIPLPKDPDEQRKIANCFNSIDNLITAQSEKVQSLKEHKKGLMQQMFPNLNT